MVGSLQRQFLVPEFRKGNYGKGIADTVNAYVDRIRNTGNVPVNSNTGETRRDTGGGAGIVSGGIGSFGCCLMIAIILIILAASRFRAA